MINILTCTCDGDTDILLVTDSSFKADEAIEKEVRNDWLWRNTPEKLEAAKALGGCSEHTFIKGGYGDSYSSVEPYAATQKELDILRENGWTIIN